MLPMKAGIQNIKAIILECMSKNNNPAIDKTERNDKTPADLKITALFPPINFEI